MHLERSPERLSGFRSRTGTRFPLSEGEFDLHPRMHCYHYQADEHWLDSKSKYDLI